jgi:hypothetical protein
MINAREAREESNKKIDYVMTDELIKIEEKIKKSINDDSGSYSTCYDGSLHQETITHLRSLGYKVEYGSPYNESYYMISW